jgi:hypothetical protein
MRIFNRPQPGFKALLLSRFLALTVLSALAMFFFGARTIGMQVREDAAEHLREAALRVCEGMEGYLDLHRHAIAALTHDLQPAPGRQPRTNPPCLPRLPQSSRHRCGRQHSRRHSP